MAQEQEREMGADALGEKLNLLLSDPESMQKLVGMASGLAQSGLLGGLLGSDSAAGAENKPSEVTQSAEESASGGAAAPVSAAPHRDGGLSGGRHTALLRALRPYLGAEKQERIDRMMKLLQLAEIADTVLRP